MLNKANDISTIHDSVEGVEVECKTVACPHCKQEVPNAIYCLLCGFPLYSIKQAKAPVPEKVEEPILLEIIEQLEPETTETESLVSLSEPDFFKLTPVETMAEPETFESEPEIVETSVPESIVEVVMREQIYPPPEFIASIPEPLVAEETIVEDVEIMLDEIEKSLGDTQRDRSTMQVYFNEPLEIEQLEDDEELHGEYEPEALTKEILKDLMNSISLKLWAVKLLCEGRVKEDHFERLFKGYVERYNNCLAQRDKLLEKAHDINSFTQSLEQARVGLGELEVRKSLGDLHKGEYEAKAPAYNWDMQFFEREIEKKKGEISYLENPGKLLPETEIVKLQELAQKNYEALDNLEVSGAISVETAETVRLSLQKDLSFVRSLKGF